MTACPATKILTMLSKRHMLVIVHALKSEARGFSDLQESLGINTATLTNRLRELETANLVEKIHCPKDSRAHYYGLTKRGQKMSQLIAQFSSV